MSADVVGAIRRPYAAAESLAAVDHLVFLKSLWGLVAFCAVAFPLANALLRFIPMDETHVSALVTVSTILSLLSVLYIYANRREMFAGERPRGLEATGSRISGRAVLFTIVAVVAFYAYYVLADVVRITPDVQSALAAAQYQAYLVKPSLILAYSLCFAALASAFNLLAMKLVMDEQAHQESLGLAPR